MKTRKSYLVQHLLVYASEKEVTNKTTGTKSIKAGALIFTEDLPNGAGVTVKNVLTLTGKQIDMLSAMYGVTTKGRKGWNQFAKLIGVNRSRAIVSSEPHLKGESYIDVDGVEQLFKENSTRNTIDSVTLNSSVLAKFDEINIREILGSWEDVNAFDEQETAKEVELTPATA